MRKSSKFINDYQSLVPKLLHFSNRNLRRIWFKICGDGVNFLPRYLINVETVYIVNYTVPFGI